MPGFIDSHVHLTSLGLSAENEDVAATDSAAALLEVAAARARGATEGVVSLQGYDETLWGDPTLPTVDDARHGDREAARDPSAPTVMWRCSTPPR